MILKMTNRALEQSTAPETSLLPIQFSSYIHQSKTLTSNDLLETVFECFWGQIFPSQGSLLFDQNASLIHATPKAEQLCQAIFQEAQIASNSSISCVSKFVLPPSIQVLCKLLTDSQSVFPREKILLQEELFGENELRVHLQAKWIDFNTALPACILITLEDLTQSAQQRSHGDAFRYNLTPREREVWSCYLQGLSYSQIASQLFIACSTVKKHMKNIHSKCRGEVF